ncbi:hypothetical protein ACXYMX_04455 [Sporosarcina sp. CAU 1771]
MERLNIESEEMQRRQDKDYIASLRMVGEGAPDYFSVEDDWDEEVQAKEDKKLPRTYQ